MSLEVTVIKQLISFESSTSQGAGWQVSSKVMILNPIWGPHLLLFFKQRANQFWKAQQSKVWLHKIKVIEWTRDLHYIILITCFMHHCLYSLLQEKLRVRHIIKICVLKGLIDRTFLVWIYIWQPHRRIDGVLHFVRAVAIVYILKKFFCHNISMIKMI